MSEQQPQSMRNQLVPAPQRVPVRRTRDEREFLPAALEIIETPVSPAGRVMMGLIGLLVLVAVVWATIGRIDIVATAAGRIIPSGQIKLIQPLQIGVVKRIAVADGDHVTANQVLVELDTTNNAADRDRYAHDLMQADLDVARLRAVLSGNSSNFVAPPDSDPALTDVARRQMAAQLAQLRAKLDDLDQQMVAKAAERDQAKATIAKIDASLPLVQQKLDIYNKLRATQFTSEVTRLDTERQLVEEKHDRDAAVEQVSGAIAQIAALAHQRSETDAEFRSQALDDLRKATQLASEQREELIKATQLTGLQVLRSPVSGTVEQLGVHTIGGVVQPAQTLMVVVPDQSKLEVEAMLPNRDAGFVHAGEAAELKIEAFNYTRYGLLHGVVRTVSRDALRNERDAPNPDADQDALKSNAPNQQSATPSDTAYVARVSLNETSVQTEQGRMPLEPGMTVTAEIKTGDRTLISYILSPFMQWGHEALRDR
ncbi:MAG TPA: HlyD family type I secretion periplasmic adaptor subunit [Micropepsaceae bacterium]|nr:HlyD family type I secretion periplasmic adaptor subunit [Micropepsaceae bacterium]